MNKIKSIIREEIGRFIINENVSNLSRYANTINGYLDQMQNIDSFIRRKHGLEKITYPDDSLADILKDTYGIMIYQEQIMLVLVKMANYSFAEADNIRRAMSKKKLKVLQSYL